MADVPYPGQWNIPQEYLDQSGEIRNLRNEIERLTVEGTRKQAQLDQIARLAKDSLDGRYAEGEDPNILNAIYWHAIDKAEPDTNLSESISSGGIDSSDATKLTEPE